MAKRKKRGKKRFGKRFLIVFLPIIIALILLRSTAAVTHLRKAEVYLKDLPVSFDGTRILYMTDIDLCGTNTLVGFESLCRALTGVNCDLVLLGGDFVSPDLINRLNGTVPDARTREGVFTALEQLKPTLGFCAVAGDNDGDAEALRAQMEPHGITLLEGGTLRVSRGADTLTLAGLSENTSAADIARTVKRDDCVILMTHTPETLTQARVSEASDGGSWADLALCGHTHGGQINLFGRSVLPLTERENQYLHGWTRSSTPVLVSSGVGCETVNMRIGSESEVWLITLRGGAALE